MTFFKGIILLVFCIGWVKAIQYDIDAEFNKIVHKVQQSMNNTWRWIQTQVGRINEVISMRRPTELGPHKYQDVMPPDNEALKSNDKSAVSEKIPLPQKIENIENPATNNASAPEIKSSSNQSQEINKENTSTNIASSPKVESSTPPQEVNNENTSAKIASTSKVESSTPPQEVNKESTTPKIASTIEIELSTPSQEVNKEGTFSKIASTPKVNSSAPTQEFNIQNTDTTVAIPAEVPNPSVNPPESVNLQEVKQNEPAGNQEELQKSTELPETECEDSATDEPTTTIQDANILQKQSKADIPLKDEHTPNKLESSAVQEINEGNSQPLQNELESDIKMKIGESSAEKEKANQVHESDIAEPAESQNSKVETLRSIYSQQSVLIKILCCVVILLALRSIFSFVETEILHRDSGIVIAAIGNLKNPPTVSVVRSENLIKREKK